MNRGLPARIVHRILIMLYKRRGWTAVGDIPASPKYVLIASPHTSNWDFPYVLGLFDDLGVEAHFMAKKSIFRWPFGTFMREVGGVPVDRAAAGDMVSQMVAEFARRDQFILTIAPEDRKSVV